MENYDRKESIDLYSFLSDPDAKQAFAPIDYSIKNGVHIQRWSKQELLFRFIEKHYVKIKAYYLDFFGVSLEYAGEAMGKYYYPDFPPDSRGEIPVENRHFISNESVIVGFLLYKIIFIDGYVELDSIPTLQRMIRQDYEDLKPGIYRALARARKLNSTEIDDQKVDAAVERALREFAKIGWIDLDDQRFEPLPSFQRLPKLYGDYINNPNLWQKDDPQS